MSEFKKGESGNKAGRPKGAENKFTREVKDVIQRLLNCMTDEDLEEIYLHLKTEKPETLINFIGKIAPKDLNVKTDLAKNPLLEKLAKFDVKSDDNTNIS
jgi:hypothetical protein